MKLYFFRLFSFGIFLIAFAVLHSTVLAQTAPPENKTTADENFQLNIGEKRTVEKNYERSTQVSINSDNSQKSLSVGVGAAVKAESINITLRGITGTVRFRASLESLQQRIEHLKQNRPPQDAGNR